MRGLRHGAAVLALAACGCAAVAPRPAASGDPPPIVRLEVDPFPEFPDPRCLSPMRLRNETAGFRRVSVTYRMDYKGVGPGCEVEWSAPPETVELAGAGNPGHWGRLGCSVYVPTGSFCREERKWTVLSARTLPAP
ncbi:hypothetical protein [Phenylobacterium sp.]|uniref:hypothetical protein n=1 Tax=Phenylobacterium sp. TaxID=1871053 RepID=UPI002D1A4DD5|nr:hypothetical protein [Phenylobacterium sp.]HVI33236.1 hypothetical protein [Phenylobacterium sp.]